MNYGRYFRLNRNLSRIEDGFAIYDYIDLPVYFIASEDNIMSPKYPISMMVTSDSVTFRLHYSAYKIEEDTNINKKDPNYPHYLYESGNYLDKKNHNIKSGDTTKIVHMEEVILELPFVDTERRMLSDTIRSIYNTNFPQILRYYDTETSNTPSIKNNSSGGRFLEKKIRKRYLEENVKDVDDEYYKSLRRLSDGTTSYSTLWLMGLIENERFNLLERSDKKGNKKGIEEPIVGFLRKLLLDYMFDLKHSDVFKNSACYQKMYSGLMSDFYFSALMHKCEYYYYRVLVVREIENRRKNINFTTKDDERLLILYGWNLKEAEELWTQDIMNPLAEKYFDYPQNTNTKIDKPLVRIHLLEDNLFIERNSWFTEPEEEMRRVCFPMNKTNKKEKDVCNVDLLVNCLGLHNEESRKLTEYSRSNREIISRWFLKRYDFNDVCHLHLARWANVITSFFLFISLLLFVLIEDFSNVIIEHINSNPDSPTYVLLCIFAIIGFSFWLFGNKEKKKEYDLLSTF